MTASAKACAFIDKFGVLDLVERAGPVGQLHTGLKDAVALPGDGCFPVATGLAQAFNGKGLAARAPRRRHGRQRRIARDHAIGRDRRDHVNQGIESGPFFPEPAAAMRPGVSRSRVLALALEPWPGRAFRRERLGNACRGAFLRDAHALWATTAASTRPPAIAD